MGPYRDTRKTKKPEPGTLVGHQQDPRKNRKPGPGILVGPQQDPRKNGKRRPQWDSSGTLLYKPKNWTLEKPENRDFSGTLRKPKKWDTVPQQVPKIGKAGPNVTLEKLHNFKSTFINLLFPPTKGDRIQITTSNTLISFTLFF